MEIGIVLSGVAIIGLYLGLQALRAQETVDRPEPATFDPQAQLRQQAMERERRQRARRHAVQQQAARAMQLAIQQLSQSPDFRRAASFAQQAATAGVPVDFRQRQFGRLRSLLVEHFARRLQSGATLATAGAGLRELIHSLGVAGYEAEYIALEAQERQRPVSQATPTYRDRLKQLQAEHHQRLEAIRATPDLEAEVGEQLQEAEAERFRREMLDELENRS